MKINILYFIVSGILLLGPTAQGLAQNNDCTQCEGSSATGTNASAIGKNTTASGNNAFAGGYNSIASGSNSIAFGYGSNATQSTNIAIGNTALATGIGSTAIGTYVKANAQNTYVIGAGATSSAPLTNNTPNSIALGVNSNKPTVLITKALNSNYTGKVAIGQVTSPQAKLHIKSDSNEDAGILVEPSNKNLKKAFIKLFDTSHFFSVDNTGTMTLSSGTGMLSFTGSSYCFGSRDEAKARIYTNTEYRGICFNVNRARGKEYRDNEAPSYAIDFNDNSIDIRTAVSQPQRGSLINNWKNALFLCTDGKIGIGSKTTYIENKDDENLILQSPKQVNINAQGITLNGKIGINTANDVDDYALAVNGGILSTKVYIKEASQWPDYVFSDDYQLMSLDELKSYLEEHKHLPGIPSEAEVSDQGYDLHTMQCLLLEKIEEMARYIMVLKQEIDSLKASPKPNSLVQFSYDGCGNRIARSLIIEQLPRQGQDLSKPDDLSYEIFPNPTEGMFTVLIKETKEAQLLQATLYTSNGSVLERQEIQNEQSVFDLSSQANGIYLLEIASPQGTQTWKVVKQ